ncbi:glycerophosphodiester phosphodiesterase [Virgibacillus siamensis]|uniref:glycerophosphodiester phosphodiesterase n=1 Tax=Virgibacillus siamensis TaxID=480071 RepID=UPI000984C905|nr:glycerophosphodiester phosphodiesterase [Virgibacillus siamensis]
MSTAIIAHRGASKVAPENTMSAFKIAYQSGADGIETDVQLTKDRVPVLMHDERLKRTTNGSGYIKNYTFHELQSLDAGSWFSKNFSGEKIITLHELLKWLLNKPLYLNIELKNNKIDYENLENIVVDMISQFHLQNRTIISTFNPTSVRRLRTVTQQIEIAYLTSKRKHNIIRNAKQLGANAVHVKYRLLSKKLMQQSKEENMPVRVYTVNRPGRMRRCFDYQCDGIFTDQPEQALHYRRQFGSNFL